MGVSLFSQLTSNRTGGNDLKGSYAKGDGMLGKICSLKDGGELEEIPQGSSGVSIPGVIEKIGRYDA